MTRPLTKHHYIHRGEFHVDLTVGTAWFGPSMDSPEFPIELSMGDYQLLLYFMRNPNKFKFAHEIEQEMYDLGCGDRRTPMPNRISILRRKFGLQPEDDYFAHRGRMYRGYKETQWAFVPTPPKG